MPGGPLGLQGIRTDHIEHPAAHTSGPCESAVAMGGQRLQCHNLIWIWSAVCFLKKNVAIWLPQIKIFENPKDLVTGLTGGVHF